MSFRVHLAQAVVMLGPWVAVAMGCGSSISGGEGSSDGQPGEGGACSYPWVQAPARFDAYRLGEMAAPSCGVQTWEPLPCGGCAGDQVCAAGHTRECCGMAPIEGTLTSPLDQWLCSCEGGTWQCWVLFPAASVCICGSDAGTD